ncbi:MAG: hypothetical protein ACK58T_46255, partial [Phycisphaerae bacterium]
GSADTEMPEETTFISSTHPDSEFQPLQDFRHSSADSCSPNHMLVMGIKLPRDTPAETAED